MTEDKHLTVSSKSITTRIRLMATGRERQLALVIFKLHPNRLSFSFAFRVWPGIGPDVVTSVLFTGSFAGLPQYRLLAAAFLTLAGRRPAVCDNAALPAIPVDAESLRYCLFASHDVVLVVARSRQVSLGLFRYDAIACRSGSQNKTKLHQNQIPGPHL